MALERREWSGARSASVGAAKGMGMGRGRIRAPAVQAMAQVTGGGTHDADRGTKAWGPERDPGARTRAPWAPRPRQDEAREPRGGGGAKRGGQGAGPQPDLQTVQCIPLGIQQMLAHHTHHHNHHAHLYNIDPDARALILPQPPRPQHQPASPAPSTEPARMAAASAAGWRGAAPAPQAQWAEGEPARGGSRGAGLGTGNGTPWGVRPSP